MVHEQDDLIVGIPLQTLNGENRMAMNISKRTPSAGTRRSLQTFELAAPAAKHVELVGNFTHWQQSPISLRKSRDGMWRASVILGLGRHEYRFLVDDQWCDDPKCARHEPNPYGGQNDVRQVA